jgi:rubrerythrin
MSEKTMNNIKEAFVGEAKAYFRLLAFAKRADKDGYTQIAKLFRVIAEAEKVHAQSNFRLLESVKSTEENLQSSFESETKVSGNVYPRLIKEAEEEGNKAAVIVFSHSRDVEDVHAKLYKSAMDGMVNEKSIDYSVCQVCGYVAEGEPPDTCPICNAKKEMFLKVE